MPGRQKAYALPEALRNRLSSSDGPAVMPGQTGWKGLRGLGFVGCRVQEGLGFWLWGLGISSHSVYYPKP